MWVVVLGDQAGCDRQAGFPAAAIASRWHVLFEADLLERGLVEVLAYDALSAASR
jgi:hypothetical protein